MQKQLTTLVNSLEEAQGWLRRLSDTTPEKDWSKRPGPERWSAADCVEHLNITSRTYLPLLRDAIVEARELRIAPTTHYKRDAAGWFMSLAIGPMHHLGKFRIGKVKTLPDFVPKGGQPPRQFLSEFVQLQSQLMTMVRSADGLPLDRVKILSPFGKRIHYNAYSALVMVARHQHRHIEQAQEALAR